MDSSSVPPGVVEALVEAGAEAVALVGSRATGDATDGSDLDLAVVGDGPRYRLERHGDLLVSLAWATAAEQRRRLFDPAHVGTHVPGWRAALLVHDPDEPEPRSNALPVTGAGTTWRPAAMRGSRRASRVWPRRHRSCSSPSAGATRRWPLCSVR